MMPFTYEQVRSRARIGIRIWTNVYKVVDWGDALMLTCAKVQRELIMYPGDILLAYENGYAEVRKPVQIADDAVPLTWDELLSCI